MEKIKYFATRLRNSSPIYFSIKLLWEESGVKHSLEHHYLNRRHKNISLECIIKMGSSQEQAVPKKKQEQQKPIFVPSQLHNANILSYYKDISCLVLGSACGILQLHAIQGLLFFIIMSSLSSAVFQFSMTRFGTSNGKGHAITEFYASPIKDIYLGDIGRNAATFTMMWCLLNALVSY